MARVERGLSNQRNSIRTFPIAGLGIEVECLHSAPLHRSPSIIGHDRGSRNESRPVWSTITKAIEMSFDSKEAARVNHRRLIKCVTVLPRKMC